MKIKEIDDSITKILDNYIKRNSLLIREDVTFTAPVTYSTVKFAAVMSCQQQMEKICCHCNANDINNLLLRIVQP
jgi:hypothetical protein